MFSTRQWTWASMICAGVLSLSSVCLAGDQEKADKPEFPPLDQVTKGFTEVKAPDDSTPYLRIWKNDKTGQMLAQLPKNYKTARQFIAPTISGGERFAGLQSDAFYVYWKPYGKRVALIQENLEIKGSDEESKSSVQRLFTDRVLLSMPILTHPKGAGPVIDLDALLVGNASTFLGVSPNSMLVSIKKTKVFESNVEVAFEVPMYNGTLKTLHYSISEIKGSPNYKPRVADQRIGYFTTSYNDYGKYEGDDTAVRYVNRWHLEKRKKELKLSPPKHKIRFYIEHTTPVRYRRWVRKGILSWNEAFEQIGIEGAIEVMQQDQQTGEYMDLDPENVRYNFVRWLNNNISTAIGPSRVNPLTGEILDADIVLTDGWIRVFEDQFADLMPKIAMDGMTAETMAWLEQHPNWDPRIRLAEPSARDFVRQQLEYTAEQNRGIRKPWELKTRMMGDEPLDGISDRHSQTNGACMAAEGRAFDVTMMRFAMLAAKLERLQDDDDDDDKEKDDDEESDEDKEQLLDGMPESFIGPLLADLVAHEVGHTLGLRHNFKASSIVDIAELNSEEYKGKQPFAGSVMDYLPTNFKVKNGEIQGDYAMIGIGPYDFWAIEYGYTLDDKKLPEILKRVAEPELVFATDEDTLGPDPLARRYDFGKNPLDFAEDQMELAHQHREKILESFVEDGEPWEKARRGYLMTLGLQVKSASMMANWLGGTYVYRDKKGDPNGRTPVQVVEAKKQRDALNFVIENMFFDEAYGLNPELINHMTVDYFDDTFNRITNEPAWPIHDRIMGVQATALTQLLNPTTLRRVYDNEFRVPADDDAVTLKEVMDEISNAIWSELDKAPKGKFSVRKPAISSLRRNLQSEHLERLFDLGSERGGPAAMKPIADLAAMRIKQLQEKLEKAVENERFDDYTKAHLNDSLVRVTKWLEAQYVVSAN
ncbi:MAG: zinc-dependent metalloprotease [Planctomycetota bacterium]